MTTLRRSLRFGYFGLLGLLLAACKPSTLIEQFADPEKQKIALEYLGRLNNGDSEGLMAELDPTLRGPNTSQQFKAMASAVTNEKPITTNLVGYFVNSDAKTVTYNLTYQFGYGSKWVVESVAWRERPNQLRTIVGMSAQRRSESLQETNALTLKHASTVHYVFLFGIIAVPLFSLATLVACIRTKPLRRKWLWIIFILLGIGKFSLNWTTSAVSFQPLSVLLLGAAGFASSLYSPWVFSLGLPLGAIAFWIRRRRPEPTPAEQPVPSASVTKPPTGESSEA